MSTNTNRRSRLSSKGISPDRFASLRRRLAATRIVASLPFERIGHHLTLVAFIAAGHLLALMLFLVVPLYADGVNSHLLQESLLTPGTEQRQRNSLLLKHFTSLYGPVTTGGFTAADTYITHDAGSVAGLPITPVQSFVYSDKLRLTPANPAGDLGNELIAYAALGFDDSLANRIELVEGRLPATHGVGEPLDVLVSQSFVNKYGLRLGDRLVVHGSADLGDPQLPVTVNGIWRPKGGAVSAADQPHWPLQPFAYDDVFILPRATFISAVAPQLGASAWYSLLWYTQFPRQAVTISNAAQARGAFAELPSRAARLLGGRVDIESPDQYLADFQQRATTLRTLLYIFSIPTLLIVVLYIVSTGSLFAERQRAEIAVLKGRGASRSQILAAYLVEGAVVDLLPLVLGPFAAFGAALLIGRTQAFLRFGTANTLPITMTIATGQLALGVLLATLVLGLLPVVVAAQQTLVSYQQQIVRSVQQPLWQRLYLDVLILLAAAYGYYVLRRQGSLVALGAANADPFSNPLSLLLPATALLGSSLVAARCFSTVAGLLAWLGRHFIGATTLLALRHLHRSPEQSRSIVLLTVLTLALGSFSASMATTLDRNDTDRILFATGGAFRVTDHAQQSLAEERWTSLPPWEYGKIADVRAWSRMLHNDVMATVGTGVGAPGTLIALDRAGFTQTGWWRPDLAGNGDSLGHLMNVLAAEPQAVIVNRAFLQAARLNLGDPLTLAITSSPGETGERQFIIRAIADNFPTVYQKPGTYTFIANFDYVTLLNDPAHFDVLLQLAPGATPDAVVAAFTQAGFNVDNVQDAHALVAAAQARPERTGFVGLLSLGFVASAGLTMLALLLYSLFSFRRRMVEIGVLRAAGLSLLQLGWLLAFELCFLILTSAVAGTALGVAAARLFVPFYQLGNTIEARTPAFIVVIAWAEIGRLLLILGAMLLATLIATLFLLRRLRIHEAIKLGQELV
ncbi:MAG: hypothetical protein H0X37_22590 [Herpetosiphonaceae bacterium]|nr:hypothetical protein [Herpetosiphonaceae bacterium]